MLLFVVLLALLAWDLRLWVVGGFAALFLLVAVGFYRALMRAVDAPEPAFAATLSELQRDIANLKAATGHAGTPD